MCMHLMLIPGGEFDGIIHKAESPASTEFSSPNASPMLVSTNASHPVCDESCPQQNSASIFCTLLMQYVEF